MAPTSSTTEQTILTHFLLPPSPLPIILSLAQFTAFFPKSQQSSPQIRILYRDLQTQRASVSDTVARNIILEVKRGNAQRRAVIRGRRVAEGGNKREEDEEMEVEDALSAPLSNTNLPTSKPHTLTSILPSLAAAIDDIETEIELLDEDSERALVEIQEIVGGLSDLRYGRLSNGGLREEVLEGLARLDGVCDQR